MCTLATRLLLIALLLSCVCVAQTSLTDAQVTDAINNALFGKRHQIGLTLNDVQTNLFSGLMCKTCQTTGYTIYVYTPESWIELKAVQAHREMLPFGLSDVTPEMRLPYIHVLASPSQPEYLNASGMGMASSVHRVVLSSTDRSDVVQPLSESHDEVELNSALRSFTQASAGAVFSVADVERLRSEDPNQEFFIVVVGDNQNKYFKVKSRFFKRLFGATPEPIYSGTKPVSVVAKAMESRANGNAELPTAARPEPTFSSASNALESAKVDTTTPQPRSVEPAQMPQAETTPPTTSSARAPIASSSASDTPTEGPVKQRTATKSHPQSPKAAAAPVSTSQTVADPGSSAYKHDSALVAQWWHLNEPAASAPTNSNTTGHVNVSDKGVDRVSLGAWTDEKPTIQRDGVRVDHIIQGGPADQVGVEVGDDILALGGVYVFTAQELTDNLHLYKPGNRVALRFRRRSTIYDTFVVMGSERSLPDSPH